RARPSYPRRDRQRTRAAERAAVLADRRSRDTSDRCGRTRPSSPETGARMMSTEIDDAVTPGVHLRGIEMSFNAVRALKGVDFSVRPGEVVGLVGDNGAGKSTLAKIMAGALSPDKGRIVIDGTARSFSNVRDAHGQGITMLFQDLALCDDLNVADNFFV